jgi:DNA-binding XRE family transcriptional regulator
MYCVDLYSRVCRACHVDGMSKSAAARLLGINRKTVAKILKHSVPPGYRRTALPVRPKLDLFLPIIDQILEDDKRVIKKQRRVLIGPIQDKLEVFQCLCVQYTRFLTNTKY